MRTWLALRNGGDDQAAAARLALILSLSLIGMFVLYCGALYVITH